MIYLGFKCQSISHAKWILVAQKDNSYVNDKSLTRRKARVQYSDGTHALLFQLCVKIQYFFKICEFLCLFLVDNSTMKFRRKLHMCTSHILENIVKKPKSHDLKCPLQFCHYIFQITDYTSKISSRIVECQKT